jgi:hypothetical protein
VTIIRIVDENFTDPAVPRTPEGAANWDDVDRTGPGEDEVIDVKDDLAENTGVSPRVPGQDNLLMRLLSRLAPAPKARRWLFDILTLVIAVVVLFLTAWKEKYVDVNTFGSFSNYVDLALWGFGVGAARQAVVTMAKGWGIALP